MYLQILMQKGRGKSEVVYEKEIQNSVFDRSTNDEIIEPIHNIEHSAL